MRGAADLTGGVVSLLVQMSEGNPGAAGVLADLIKDDPEGGFMKVLHLDDMNIRGSQIWVGYKDHCGQDLEVFKKALVDRDQAMVDTINGECFQPDLGYEGYKEKAVPSGASFGRR